MSRANLSKADLSRGDLRNADLSRSQLAEADLSAVKANAIDLSWSELTDARLVDAALDMANLNQANLNRADLSGSKLVGTDLRDAHMVAAILKGVDLSKARMARVDLRNADLSDTICVGIDLSEADITGADIANANMSDWTITNIICSHAFSDGRRIDFKAGEFEKTYSVSENTIRLELELPMSDIAYYTGRIIERALKHTFGDHTLFFEGLRSSADGMTRFLYRNVGTSEQLNVVGSKLAAIRQRLEPILTEIAKNDSKSSGLKPHEITAIPFQPAMIARPKEIVTQMNDRYVKMHTLIRHVLLAVTEETKAAEAQGAHPPVEKIPVAGGVCIETDEFVMF